MYAQRLPWYHRAPCVSLTPSIFKSAVLQSWLTLLRLNPVKRARVYRRSFCLRLFCGGFFCFGFFTAAEAAAAFLSAMFPTYKNSICLQRSRPRPETDRIFGQILARFRPSFRFVFSERSDRL